MFFVYTCIRQRVVLEDWWFPPASSKRSKRSHVMWIHVGSLQRVSCSNEKGPSWEDQRVSPPWRISMQQVLPDMGQVVRIFAFPKPLKTGGWADWAKK